MDAVPVPVSRARPARLSGRELHHQSFRLFRVFGQIPGRHRFGHGPRGPRFSGGFARMRTNHGTDGPTERTATELGVNVLTGIDDEVFRVTHIDERYWVSNYGRVVSAVSSAARLLRPVAARVGYLKVGIYVRADTRGQRWCNVSRLVLFAFEGPPPPERPEAAHNNGIRSDNTARNLRWANKYENEADKIGHGTDPSGARNGRVKLAVSDVMAIRNSIGSGRKIGGSYGISAQHVNRIRARRSWQCLSDAA